MSLNLQTTTVSTTPMNGAFNYDVNTQVIFYSTVAATGNFQLNFRGDSVTPFATVVPVGNTLTTFLFVRNGLTPYALTGITIDGVTPTAIGYLNRLPQSGPSSDIAAYQVNISHTAAGVFTVF